MSSEKTTDSGSEEEHPARALSSALTAWAHTQCRKVSLCQTVTDRTQRLKCAHSAHTCPGLSPKCCSSVEPNPAARRAPLQTNRVTVPARESQEPFHPCTEETCFSQSKEVLAEEQRLLWEKGETRGTEKGHQPGPALAQGNSPSV